MCVYISHTSFIFKAEVMPRLCMLPSSQSVAENDLFEKKVECLVIQAVNSSIFFSRAQSVRTSKERQKQKKKLLFFKE